MLVVSVLVAAVFLIDCSLFFNANHAGST